MSGRAGVLGAVLCPKTSLVSFSGSSGCSILINFSARRGLVRR